MNYWKLTENSGTPGGKMDSIVVEDKKRNRMILFSIAFASFMVNVDTYIVNISLPVIAKFFNVGTGNIAWVVLSYQLTVTSLLLVFGRLGDKIGLKKVFILGFVLFTISSAMCGYSPSLLFLIISRAIQGIGASVLYALTPAMVPKFLPEKMRGPAFGTLATVAALGITVGTPLGGIITGYLHWSWIFLINIPTGILAIIVCLRVIPDEPPSTLAKDSRGFDLMGSLLSFIWSFSIIYALSEGDQLGWSSLTVLACFIIFIISLSAFIIWEKHVSNPLFDLSLFTSKAFTYGNIASVLAYAFLAGNNFLMPFYLQYFKGLRPEQAGFVFLVYSIVYGIVGPISGKLSLTINPRILCTFGMLIASVAAFVLAFTLKIPGLVVVIGYFIVLAVAISTFCTSNNNVVMGMAPQGKQGIVSGVFRMGTRLGMAFGVCIFGTVFSMSTMLQGKAAKATISAMSKDIMIGGFHNTYIIAGLVCLMAVIFSVMARTDSVDESKARIAEN